MTHAEANPATEHPGWAQVLALVLASPGGGIAGVALSGRLAPDSALAQFVGLFSFSLPFLVGMNFWLGLAYGTGCWLLARSGYLPFPSE